MHTNLRFFLLGLTLVNVFGFCHYAEGKYTHTIANQYGDITISGDSQLDLDVQLKSWFWVTQSVIESTSYAYLSTQTLSDESIQKYIEDIRDVALKYGHNDRTLLKNILHKASVDCAYHQNNIGNPRDPRTGTLAFGHFASSIACLGVTLFSYYYWFKPVSEELSTYPPKVTWTSNNPNNPLQKFFFWYRPQFTKSYHNQARLEMLEGKRRKVLLCMAGTGLASSITGALGCMNLKEFLTVDPKHQEKYDILCKVTEHLEKALARKKTDLLADKDQDDHTS